MTLSLLSPLLTDLLATLLTVPPALHLGALHPVERLLVLVVAFGPFVVLFVVVYVVRRRDIAEEEQQAAAVEQPPVNTD
jgi:hypothetical protein